MKELEGKSAIIAGGGRGIGRACAEVLAENGADVFIGSRTTGEVDTAVADIIATGGSAKGFPLDVTDTASVNAFVDQVIEAAGKIDILIYVAGTNRRGPMAQLTEEDWMHVINVNLTGAYRVCRAVGRHMVERQEGSIVTITSMTSHVVMPNVSAYAASKGGLLQLTKALAVEWAGENIRVNAVSPGWIATDLNRKVLNGPNFQKVLYAKTPQHRYGEAREIAESVAFLASPRAAFITGIALPVDGGFLAGHPHIRPGEMD
jgi:NAD(P)-dependent dehydrogenase (short-subunit alcohol dehydrogenase family)